MLKYCLALILFGLLPGLCQAAPIECQAGFGPGIRLYASLDINSKELIYRNLRSSFSVQGITTVISGAANFTKKYYLPYEQGKGITFAFDGTQPWLCLDINECYKCN